LGRLGREERREIALGNHSGNPQGDRIFEIAIV